MVASIASSYAWSRVTNFSRRSGVSAAWNCAIWLIWSWIPSM